MNETVEIALVVRNEERRIHGALENLRAQRDVDLRIVVHDNASDDRTAECVETIARADPRVTLVRHDRDLGILHNFVRALCRARSPYFGWAAADDRRSPEHLAVLSRLLHGRCDAALAASAACPIGPDGLVGAVLDETRGLSDLPAGTGAARLAAWLRRAPCVPFYGVYRTALVRALVPRLSALADPPNRPQLRADALFLAEIVARHPVVIVPTPMFHFRLGGTNERLERFDRLADLALSYRVMHRSLCSAARAATGSPADRAGLALALHAHLLAVAGGRDGRLRLHHALTAGHPRVRSALGRWAAATDPSLRRLRRRARALTPGTRIVIAGAGKHTHRRLDALRSAIPRHAPIVAIADDAARGSLHGIPIVGFAELRERADLVIVSSDACEARLRARAQSCTPAPVWVLYEDEPPAGAGAPVAPA